MKVKSETMRALGSIAIGFLASCASALCSSTAFLPAQELGIETIDNSDSRHTVVWGAPLRFVVDMLNSARIGQIDGKDNFSDFAFLVNWLIWIVIFILSIYFVRFIKFMMRPNG